MAETIHLAFNASLDWVTNAKAVRDSRGTYAWTFLKINLLMTDSACSFACAVSPKEPCKLWYAETNDNGYI